VRHFVVQVHCPCCVNIDEVWVISQVPLLVWSRDITCYVCEAGTGHHLSGEMKFVFFYLITKLRTESQC